MNMPHHDISILVVDDEAANVGLLTRILRRAGYVNIHGTTNPREVTAYATAHHPDIVLLDLHMPTMSGVDVMRELRELPDLVYPFVVVLTGDDSQEAKARALSNGARDFIAKPFDTNEVALRIKNLADLRVMHKQLYQDNVSLEQKVHARTLELEQARLDIIERLGLAGEFRDDATGRHTRRVGISSAAIARVLGLDDANVELIARAAPLHDVGKIAIPDRILLKPGPLDAEEMQIMRSHTTIGARLLSSSQSPLLEAARAIALAHHERWDGTGYPAGLAGADIPLAGRIVAIADFYDALSHDRPYRKRLAHDDVLATIVAERGRHFDPAVHDAFLSAVQTLDPNDLA